MNFNKEQIEKIILGVIAAVIILMVLIFFILGPNIRRIGSLRSKIREQKVKVLQAEREIASLARIKDNLEKMELKVSEYETDLPETTEYWLLGTLNQLAEEAGISFHKTERKGYTLQVDNYSLQELEIELRIGYHELGGFINQLEGSSPFIVVRNLSIVRNPKNMKQHNVTLTVGVFEKIQEEKGT